MLPLRGCGKFLEKVACDKCLKVFHIVTNDWFTIVMIIAAAGLSAAYCRAWEAATCLGMGNLVLITQTGVMNCRNGFAFMLTKSWNEKLFSLNNCFRC